MRNKKPWVIIPRVLFLLAKSIITTIGSCFPRRHNHTLRAAFSHRVRNMGWIAAGDGCKILFMVHKLAGLLFKNIAHYVTNSYLTAVVFMVFFDLATVLFPQGLPEA